ncbi:MAG: hypothetical protein ACKVN9_09895 [Methylophilaceae bacterium]
MKTAGAMTQRRVAGNINIVGLLLILGVGFCAVFFGMLAATANPILIGLGIGLFAGLFLLAMPKTTIWLVLGLGLSTGALLSMVGHGLDKISWAISMMAMLLWLPSLMQLFRRPNIPMFVWLALICVIQAIVATALQWYSAGEFIAGFKRYFQMYGLLFAFATLAITPLDFQRWLKLLLGIALLQLPFAVYERFVLAAQRGSGGEATDVVAGTMGANLVGGSPNSVMALFLLLAIAFIFMRWRAGLLATWKLIVLGLLLLAPLTLGETKIVVVMIPLMGMVLLRKDFALNPVRYLPVLMGLVFMTVVMAYVYVVVVLDSDFYHVIKESLHYNVGTEGYGVLYLNRTSVVSFWWSLQGLHDPLGFLIGHGLGSSYGVAAGNSGHIAVQYPRYGIGLTTMSTLLWDVGVLGFALYLAMFISAWRAANRLWQDTTDALVRADVLVIQAGLAMFMLFIIYSDNQINLITMEIIVVTTLGYLAFLVQQQKSITLSPLTSR